jgi:hypothetical protein
LRPSNDWRRQAPGRSYPECRFALLNLFRTDRAARITMTSKWFQTDPHRSPDSEFEPGERHHLCMGNEGRLLDFRRTPVRIESLCDETGLATIQILAFEDKGALWDLPYEDVGKYQFRKGCSKASAEALERIQEAVTRLDHDVDIPSDLSRREQTLKALSQEREWAKAWLVDHSRFFQSGSSLPEGEAEGSPLLYADTKAYMAQRKLDDVEALFARQYASHMLNEAVKAHRIAIAQCGLAPYKGKKLRDPSQTSDALSLERRATHVIVRMGFVQAIFERCGRESIVLYRMESCEGPLRARRSGAALVSASFRMDIVQEMSGWADPKRTVAIYRQAVPIERVLMTYLETEAMNHPYREAEAVLVADPNNMAF